MVRILEIIKKNSFILEIGHLLHPCESDMVLKCTNENVPYFNAPIYLENKQQVGKVDEIFGPITEFYFSVKMSEGMNPDSFKKLQKVILISFVNPSLHFHTDQEHQQKTINNFVAVLH